MLKTDPDRTKKVIEILLDWYPKKTGVFSQAEEPEELCPKGVKVGSYDHIVFLTQSVSIDYMRSAKQLWDAARTTWEDEKTRWVFYPNEIVERNLEELKKALSKYKLSKKPNKDTKIWRDVAFSFHEMFNDDPRNLFEKFHYDAIQIYNAMRAQYGKDFPYLSGAASDSKILSLWIRMLHDYANIDFVNLDEVPIPVDIHTARATITTGCLVGKFDGSYGELVGEVKKAWFEACDKTDFNPLQLDEPLWNLSRYGCRNYKDGKPCPVRKDCLLSELCTANPSNSKVYVSKKNCVIDTHFPEKES